MSRVCLIATGVPSAVEAETHHGPGLRTTHFATALGQAGCEVLVVAVLPEDDPDRGRLPRSFAVDGREVALIETTEKRLASGDTAVSVRSFAPDAFVGISAMGSALACSLVGDAPLWADVFGDLMAEAQAKAAVYDNDTALPRFWGLLAQTLGRADRFSAVSARQGDALVGQLGLAGRLSKATMGEALVHVIPCAAAIAPRADDTKIAELRTSLGLEHAFVVLSSGSFNTWCDVDTLYDAVERAMHDCPRLHFVVTGGAVAGHDEYTYGRFRARVAAGAYCDRFHFAGWLAASHLPIYYGLADVALNVERFCYERHLGSENRVAQWLAAGLPVMSTAQSEQGGQLAASGVIEVVAPMDVAGIARSLLDLAAEPDRLGMLSREATLYAREHLDPLATAAPMVAWARAPRRAGDVAVERLVRIGLVSEPKTMVALLEAYVDELGTGELFRRGLRWLWRRVRGG